MPGGASAGPPAAAGGGTGDTCAASPRDSLGYGSAVPPSPIQSASPGCGRSPSGANGPVPAALTATGNRRPAASTTIVRSTAAVPQRSPAVSKITWPPPPPAGGAPTWNPAGTSTERVSGGWTVNCSTAAAGVAGSGPTPASRSCSTSSFSGSRFARLSTGSSWVPNSLTSATPASCWSGLVQSGV